MRNAGSSASILLSGKAFKFGNLAFCFVNVEFTVIADESHARAVVPAIFEPMQSFNNDRICLPVSDVTYYTTHK
jgi:hypothetical protein